MWQLIKKRELYYKCNIYDIEYKKTKYNFDRRAVIVRLCLDFINFKSKEKLPFMFNNSDNIIYYIVRINNTFHKKIDYNSLIFNYLTNYKQIIHPSFRTFLDSTCNIETDTREFIDQYLEDVVDEINFLQTKSTELELSKENIIYLLGRIGENLQYGSSDDYNIQFRNLSGAILKARLIKL